MSLRTVPYAIAAFMLLPFAIWFGLWIFAFQGPKQGLDGPFPVALGVVSLPLVAWFYLSTIGMLSQSIEARDEFARPHRFGAHLLLAALPWSALLLGAATVPALVWFTLPWYLVPVPAALSVLFALAIHFGEKARSSDRHRPMTVSSGSGRPNRVKDTAWRIVYAVPLLGRLIREARSGRSEDVLFFIANLVLGAVLAVILIGYPALIVIALTAAVAVFSMVLAVAAA